MTHFTSLTLPIVVLYFTLRLKHYLTSILTGAAKLKAAAADGATLAVHSNLWNPPTSSDGVFAFRIEWKKILGRWRHR